MNRRAIIMLLGGAAACPLAARAQQAVRLPRIGVLMTEEDNAEMRARLAGLRQGLERLGWSEGHNIQVDIALPRASQVDFSLSRKSWSPCSPT